MKLGIWTSELEWDDWVACIGVTCLMVGLIFLIYGFMGASIAHQRTPDNTAVKAAKSSPLVLLAEASETPVYQRGGIILSVSGVVLLGVSRMMSAREERRWKKRRKLNEGE